ncbi:unnamed protein product [Cyclocybe aegerita]|uniref:Uncharacterized protein n=1 Tax=Cyclocybe aegerita TaxID=1973307 RepID=A0A8S0VTZ3_CYCAE|nr:unnamed protein product [Cyclocybe aegerita]
MGLKPLSENTASERAILRGVKGRSLSFFGVCHTQYSNRYVSGLFPFFHCPPSNDPPLLSRASTSTMPITPSHWNFIRLSLILIISILHTIVFSLSLYAALHDELGSTGITQICTITLNVVALGVSFGHFVVRRLRRDRDVNVYFATFVLLFIVTSCQAAAFNIMDALRPEAFANDYVTLGGAAASKAVLIISYFSLGLCVFGLIVASKKGTYARKERKPFKFREGPGLSYPIGVPPAAHQVDDLERGSDASRESYRTAHSKSEFVDIRL